MPRTPTFTTSLVPPPGPNQPLILPTRTLPYPASNPPLFNDALAIRLEVFVDEQKCSADLEIDDDDARSWQWVIYDEQHRESEADTAPGSSRSESQANSKSNSSPPAKMAVAVIRLVPPPHLPHEAFAHPQSPEQPQDEEGSMQLPRPRYDLAHEPHIKFGRVAVLPQYRGFGLGRRLMETAMEWAAENAGEINRALDRVVKEEREHVRRDREKEEEEEGRRGDAPVWKGLALVHAQSQVERMYERLGFVTDEELGRWVEEGIDHVGMWKRLDVSS